MVLFMMNQSSQKVMAMDKENTSFSKSYKIYSNSPLSLDPMDDQGTHLIKSHRLETGHMLTFHPVKFFSPVSRASI